MEVKGEDTERPCWEMYGEAMVVYLVVMHSENDAGAVALGNI